MENPEAERVPVFCGRCGDLDDRRLYADVGTRHLCSDCYQDLGRPASSPVAVSLGARAAAERRILDGMVRRGGNERYMARSGKA